MNEQSFRRKLYICEHSGHMFFELVEDCS